MHSGVPSRDCIANAETLRFRGRVLATPSSLNHAFYHAEHFEFLRLASLDSVAFLVQQILWHACGGIASIELIPFAEELEGGLACALCSEKDRQLVGGEKKWMRCRVPLNQGWEGTGSVEQEREKAFPGCWTHIFLPNHLTSKNCSLLAR